MTEKLYQLDAHLRDCDATVLSCASAEGGFLVTLDRSVLFPEGGGQSCDLGRIGAARVLDVQERGGEAYHLVDRALPVGGVQHVSLDWARRFDYMQQHTGEHLVSFAAWKLCGAKNIGFHLGDEYATIHFDKPLTEEDLRRMALLVNEIIAENRAVRCISYASEEALLEAGVELRKHAEGLTAPIRIVSIDGADCCTCCAPHCARTGEIGHALITDAAPFKRGTRITYLCGMRASRFAMAEHALLDSLALRFSTARAEVAHAVEKQEAALSASRRRCRELGAQLNAYLAKELIEQAERAGKAQLVVARLTGFDAARAKALLDTLLSEKTLALLLYETDGAQRYELGCTADIGLDMGELAQAVNAATGGKGGGRGTRAQGMAPAPVAAETAEQLKRYLAARLARA